MTEGQPGPAHLVAGNLADQMVALEHRIATANRPGSLDGLFAYHVLQKRTISSFTWEVNPLSARWLDHNVDGLTHAPHLAALGYGLTHFGAANSGAARERLVAGLQHLMRRDPYPTDGVTFLHDPRQLIGIVLAAAAVRDDLPTMGDWLRATIGDGRLRVGDGRQELIRRHVRGILLDEESVLTNPTGTDDPALPRHGPLDSRGRHRPPAQPGRRPGNRPAADPERPPADPRHRTIRNRRRPPAGRRGAHRRREHRQRRAEPQPYRRGPAPLRTCHAAMAMGRPNQDQGPDTLAHHSEREVQDIVWALLRAVFDDLVDEEPLRKVGHSSYRSDFGLPRLGVLVEVKYVRSAADFKKVEKEVYEDSVTYLKDRGTYTKIVVFIYDASASVQEHATTRDALRDLENVIDVIIASRPSQLPAPGVEDGEPPPSQSKRGRARRTAS